MRASLIIAAGGLGSRFLKTSPHLDPSPKKPGGGNKSRTQIASHFPPPDIFTGEGKNLEQNQRSSSFFSIHANFPPPDIFTGGGPRWGAKGATKLFFPL